MAVCGAGSCEAVGAAQSTSSGSTTKTPTSSVSGAKYVAAGVGNGVGFIHAGCVPGSEIPSAVTWIPAHKECAGIRGLPVPIYDTYATDMAHAETCNFNMGAPASGTSVNNQFSVPGYFENV